MKTQLSASIALFLSAIAAPTSAQAQRLDPQKLAGMSDADIQNQCGVFAVMTDETAANVEYKANDDGTVTVQEVDTTSSRGVTRTTSLTWIPNSGNTATTTQDFNAFSFRLNYSFSSGMDVLTIENGAGRYNPAYTDLDGPTRLHLVNQGIKIEGLVEGRMTACLDRTLDMRAGARRQLHIK